MTIEQKAKAYDEAIKRANELLYVSDKESLQYKTIERILPELVESDDEKIRKDMIETIKKESKDFPSSVIAEKSSTWIAWLEKQGEQNNNEDADILYRFSFYSYKDEPNVIYLSGFYVNEEYRNKGIGTKILEVADEVTKSLDCHAIRLKTKKDSDAERLYQTHGYNSLSTEGKDEIWLEKQAEQNTVVIIPKFKVGDWIITNKNHIWYVDETPETTSYLYRLINQYGKVEVAEFEVVDNVARLWTIQDAKDGDVLCSEQIILLFKKWKYNSDWNCVIAYAGIDTTGKLQITNEHWFISSYVHPATKEQRNALMKAMADAGYIFDFEKKELKKIEQNPTDVKTTSYWHVEDIEQNPAWSEEDEKMIWAIPLIINTYPKQEMFYGYSKEKLISWLKSLKGRVQPQSQWKPSEEQIAAINYIIKEYESTTIHLYEGAAKQLYLLLNDLKKL